MFTPPQGLCTGCARFPFLLNLHILENTTQWPLPREGLPGPPLLVTPPEAPPFGHLMARPPCWAQLQSHLECEKVMDVGLTDQV